MNWGRFTRTGSVLGALGLGIGLAVAGCSAAATAGTGAASTTAPASTAPASTPPASTGTVVTPPPSATAPATATSPAAPANAAPVKASNGRPFVLWDCTSKPLVEPASFVIACADANDGLTGMHWTSWAPAKAAGTGTQYLNDCTPNCAEGHYHNYPVEITLTGSDLVAQNEPFAYTKITLTYPAARPAYTVLENGKPVVTHPATWSEQLWTGRPAGAKYPAGTTT